jgi:hypothetical protein
MIRPAAALSTLVLIAGLGLSTASPAATPAKPAPWKPGTKGSAPAAAPAHADTFADHELDLRQNIRYINGLPDTAGVFLPDTTVLARVDDHVFTARDFVETYYNAYAPDRPGQDSLGRVDWLNSMVNKDVLGRVARAAAAPLTFEDRITLRAHTDRVLSNVLFLRAVLDSSAVKEPELVSVYRQFPVEHHVRRLYFADPNIADQVWRDLKAKKLTWEDAAKHSLPQADAKPDGDIGWASRMNMTEEVAARLYALSPGAFTPVTEVSGGFYIYQSLARRRVEVPPYNSVRKWIYDRRRLVHIKERKDRLQDLVKREIDLHYDTTNVVFASRLFKATIQNQTDSTGAPNIRISTAVPVFRSVDTSRVVARWKDGGQMTIAGFLGSYSVLPPLSRPVVNRLDLFCNAIDTYVLEPFNAELARRRGLDHDPVAVGMIEKERERLLVEHMYRDSIEARIQVSPSERRKFYQEHLPQFYTYPAARYGQLLLADSVQAQGIVARLKAGESTEAILRADSIASRPRLGRVKYERETDHGDYHRLLFEELKPGQYEVIGPDRTGKYMIVQMLSFDPGRQLSFEESDAYAYDAIAAQKSEDMLNAMIARHRAAFRIETRPELVGRIRLVDPATDER